ncbi:cellulase family glycosylhydrolase [Nocardia sp. NPDC051981]|uniref:glycoside hydrolase family 5 protein n=1 Tax=Nocardia sp. NPDC051981 TaxID=3155417 RepID=UPI0034359FD8
MTIHDINRLLARAINVCPNLGSELESGYTIELTAHEFDLFQQAGFCAVRLGVYWAAHCGDAPEFRIVPKALDRVHTYLDLAAERDLAVVLTNFLDPDLIANPPQHLPRLLSITDQVATAFADRPQSVVLEPFTEPRDALDPLWNDTLRELLTVIRKTDTERAVVFGPGAYNNIRMLPQLALPDDPNLIVTIHQYWPITFTMQGEEWLGADTPFGEPRSWLGTTWTGTDQQRGELAAGYEGWPPGPKPTSAPSSSANSAPPPKPTLPAAPAGPSSTGARPKNTGSPGAAGLSRPPSPSTTSNPRAGISHCCAHS